MSFGKEVDSNLNSIIKASLLLHLQWFRYTCQHKAWTLCLGFVDRKTFPVLQQFILKVGKYYNLKDKVIKRSREGIERTTPPRRHLGLTWMHISTVTHLQTAAEWQSVKAALTLESSSTARAFSKPGCLLKRHNAFQLQAVFGAKHLRTTV